MISKPKYYSRQGLWSLFLMCAFPFHLWTLILSLRDISWVSERTNLWDALGVVSYGLIFAFIESSIVFCAIILLGFLISTKWDENHRIAVMSVLVLVTALWAMIGQLYFLLNISFPVGWFSFIASTEHPVRILYAIALALVLATTVIPIYLILRFEKPFRFVMGSIERISLLAAFYLVFDLIGLTIVVIRNIS